jgi:hypothetical protein
MEPLHYGRDYTFSDFSSEVHRFLDGMIPERYSRVMPALLSDYSRSIEKLTLMMDMIIFIDFMVFGEKNPPSGFGCYPDSRFGYIADYDRRRDSYGVIIGQLDKLNGDIDVALLGDETVSYSGDYSLDLVVLSIAMHEVRHRMQKKKAVKTFCKKAVTRDDKLNKYICLQRDLFKKEKRENYRRTRSRVYTSNRNRDIEFDAYLVQDYFLANAVTQGSLSLEMVRNHLFLNPITLLGYPMQKS